MTDLESLIRRAMLDEGCPYLAIVRVEGGFQVNRQNAKQSNTFRIEIMPDPADALFNALVPYNQSRKPKRQRNNEDLI